MKKNIFFRWACFCLLIGITNLFAQEIQYPINGMVFQQQNGNSAVYFTIDEYNQYPTSASKKMYYRISEYMSKL